MKFLVLFCLVALVAGRNVINSIENVEIFGEFRENSRILATKTSNSNSAPGKILIYEVTVVFDYQYIIDGLRFTHLTKTRPNWRVLDGGIGFNYIKFELRDPAFGVGFSTFIEIFSNQPVQNAKPERIVLQDTEFIGALNEQSKLMGSNLIVSTPPPGMKLTHGSTVIFPKSYKIDAIKITHLTETRGIWRILEGGIGTNFIKFQMADPDYGVGFTADIEFFGFSGASNERSAPKIVTEEFFEMQ